MAKQTSMSDDERNALLTLLKAGYKVTLYKKTDNFHSIERIYSLPSTTGDFRNLTIKPVESERDSEYRGEQ